MAYTNTAMCFEDDLKITATRSETYLAVNFYASPRTTSHLTLYFTESQLEALVKVLIEAPKLDAATQKEARDA